MFGESAGKRCAGFIALSDLSIQELRKNILLKQLFALYTKLRTSCASKSSWKWPKGPECIIPVIEEIIQESIKIFAQFFSCCYVLN